MIDRRGFLLISTIGTAGIAAGCSSKTATPPADPAVDLKFAPAETLIDLGGVSVRTWAYDGQVPGKEIRIRKGETLRAAVSNKLPADTSIHWHGLAIVNDMDGVPPLTQAPIPAGGKFTYDFVVPDAGTYWYHSHVGTQLGPRAVRSVDHRGSGREGGLRRGIGSRARRLDRRHRHQSGPGAGEPEENRDEAHGARRARGHARRPRSAATAATSPTRTSSSTAAFRPIRRCVDYRAGQRIRLRVINAGSDTAFRVAVPDALMNVIPPTAIR